ncbi:hypothetical protein [Microvirga sp. VF16]|uniref:hypothetical protein n=1 Tax=Microvirga sp. VF16 TaxID=2807101 RepID=UPI00193D11CB|nr:hypothetical protein [Microvirga sp. VF16]QRM33926.1 hypothetical protein JO965_38955 [Microvirga sp. VF16]
MEQQTIGTRHSRLPPAFLTREHAWPKKVGEGGPERPIGLSHWPINARAAGANPTGIVPWASRLHDRASRLDAPFLPDLDRAFVSPASVFDTPHDVVRHPLLTIDCKREILQRWAWDEYLLDLANTEGMPESEPSRLDEVKAALRLVNSERSPDPAAPAAFIVPYHWDEATLAA